MTAAYPLTYHYQTNEYINITRAERDAALVRMDDAIFEVNSQHVKADESLEQPGEVSR